MRHFPLLAAVVTAGLPTTGVCVQPTPLTKPAQALIGRMVSAARHNMEAVSKDDLQALAESYRNTVEEQLRHPQQLGFPTMPPWSPPTPSERCSILVSRSLGAAALGEILMEATSVSGTRVVFRGVGEKETFTDGLIAIHTLIKEADVEQTSVPPVVIDPTPFRSYGVTVVPTMICQTPKTVFLARGVTSFAAFNKKRRQMEPSSRSFVDLGQWGPTRDIEEPDLIEVMQARAAAIDWDAKRQAALKAFWRTVPLTDLPEARAPRVREIDPTVLVTEDMVAPDGTVFAAAGKRINPLLVRPFDGRLIVFDATKPRQVDVVEHVIKTTPASGDGIVLMATNMDRKAGWDGLRRIQDRLQTRLFLLQPELRERFKIETVPTVISATDTRFIITEIPPSEE